jgi:serine/threonine-protein kinase RsbT
MRPASSSGTAEVSTSRRASDVSGGARAFAVVKALDALWCQEECAAFARSHGLQEQAAWEIGISASELATNLVRHAGGGMLTIRHIDAPRPAIEIVTDDIGPGIQDTEAALADGFSEGRYLADEVPLPGREGLGTGLGAVKRLMGGLTIEGKPAGGTRVVAVKLLGRT